MTGFLELARQRRSVRSFDDNMPEKAILDQLKEFAETITNPYGVKVRFVFLDAKEHKLSSPVLTGEKIYVSAIVGKESHAEEGYGYSFEKLLMKAQELGLGNVWIGGTMPREKFEKASGLAENEVMPCVSPLGAPAKRMSVKETLMRKGVKADTRMSFEELFFEGDFSKPLTERFAKENGLYDDLEAVRIAPSAVNKQPWRIVIDGKKAHFYEKHDKGFLTPDYDLQKIDLGIALYHFESQMLSEMRAPKLSVEDPGINTPDGVDYVATYTF
ncbi:nitroreductase family protein [Butyrivibrio proteoclasticus]|uniref:nitroreductase family protein n=1 Tax=Butyrivibrio proteoclasticus TaxID=43305 RepID=UPI00047A986A|nr:nitroreductase family protein [Butyrivibrio proteoclasticus]